MTACWKFPFMTCVAMLMVGAIACGDDSDEPGTGGSLSATCMKGCAMAEGLNCAGDTGDCQSECEMTPAQLPGCESEVEAFLACAANRPTSDWECDEDDESNIKDGVCSAEETAVSNCFLGST